MLPEPIYSSMGMSAMNASKANFQVGKGKRPSQRLQSLPLRPASAICAAEYAAAGQPKFPAITQTWRAIQRWSQKKKVSTWNSSLVQAFGGYPVVIANNVQRVHPGLN